MNVPYATWSNHFHFRGQLTRHGPPLVTILMILVLSIHQNGIMGGPILKICLLKWGQVTQPMQTAAEIGIYTITIYVWLGWTGWWIPLTESYAEENISLTNNFFFSFFQDQTIFFYEGKSILGWLIKSSRVETSRKKQSVQTATWTNKTKLIYHKYRVRMCGSDSADHVE